MKKYYQTFLVSMLVIVSSIVISCDNEPVDGGITGENVGKALLTLNIEGEEQIFRDGLVGKLDKEGRFTLEVESVGKNEKNKLTLFTKLFQEGLFPTNINVCSFYDADLTTTFSSVDPLRPLLRTGQIEITFINKKARVISGSFEVRFLPEGEDVSVNAEPIRMRGTFTNIPYERVEEFYLDAEIVQNAGKERIPFRTDEIVGINTSHFVQLFEGEEAVEEQIVKISAEKNEGVDGSFEFVIPSTVEVGKSYVVDNKHIVVSYTSRASVNYQVLPENSNGGVNNRITVTSITYKEAEEGVKLVKEMTLRFDFVLTEIKEGMADFDRTVRIEYGRLNTTVE